MRTPLIVGAAVLQVLALALMAGEREWVLRNGRIVYLRTAPADPRDAFRGDYVRLDYDVSHVATNQVRGGLPAALAAKDGLKPDTRVYALLAPEADGIAHLETVTDRRPGKGLFLRGRTERWYPRQSSLTVRYGLEAYFVQQDQARLLEEGRRRNEVQVPLEMEVAVAANGLAVLKGYRRGPLGIGLRLDMTTNVVPQRVPAQVRAATIKLRNASTNELAIVDLPGGRSLALERASMGWGDTVWAWVGAAAPQPEVLDANVIVLKPREAHEIKVDLTLPEWFVVDAEGKAQSLGQAGWGARFRLVYRPPSADECRELQQAALIWHGELKSQAFFGAGGVD